MGGGEGGEEGVALHEQEDDEGSWQEEVSAVCRSRVVMTAESYSANAESFSSIYLKVEEFQGGSHYFNYHRHAPARSPCWRGVVLRSHAGGVSACAAVLCLFLRQTSA